MAFLSRAGNLLKQIKASNASLQQAVRCMSSSKVFVGGLSYGTDEARLTDAFSPYGVVTQAKVVVDSQTGRSRGFGFVTFQSSEEASAAITAMDSKALDGRIVRVNYATDKMGGNRGGGYNSGYGGPGNYNSGGYGNNDNYNAGGYGSGGYGNTENAGGYGSGGYMNNDNYSTGNNAYAPNSGGYGDDSSSFGGNTASGSGDFQYGDDGAKDYYANNRN